MKGIVLAGGNGTRLAPLTTVANKALLPVYNKPMIYHPIQTLVDSGIDDIFIVAGGNSVGQFLPILGNGEEFGLKRLHYTYQKEAGGIAQALGLAEDWASGQHVAVILADNLFEDDFKEIVKEYDSEPFGAKIFVKEVAHPEHYGVVELDGDRIVSIEEKPKSPKSNLIQTGLYFYDYRVWNIIKTLKPSRRGELEITDVNNFYLNKNNLTAHQLVGEWVDCGECLDGYLDAQNSARRWFYAKQNRKVEFEKSLSVTSQTT